MIQRRQLGLSRTELAHAVLLTSFCLIASSAAKSLRGLLQDDAGQIAAAEVGGYRARAAGKLGARRARMRGTLATLAAGHGGQRRYAAVWRPFSDGECLLSCAWIAGLAGLTVQPPLRSCTTR